MKPILITIRLILISDDDGNGAFKIWSGEIKSTDSPITLKTGEKKKLQLSFTPKAIQDYTGKLTVFNTSTNASFLQIPLAGIGGQDNSGPNIETNYGTSIDFGQVKLGKNRVDTLRIYNTGDKDLQIDNFSLDSTVDKNTLFTFANTMNFPIMVAPKDSALVRLKFAATIQTPGIYHGRINVECNAKNKTTFSIDMQGEIVTNTNGPVISTNLGTNINFDPVLKNGSQTKVLQITNTGNVDMNVTSFKMDASMPDAAQFVFDPPVTTPFVIAQKAVINISIKFAPTDTTQRTYSGKILMTSDATNNSSFGAFQLNGSVVATGVNDTYITTDDGLFTMKASPNPAGNYFNLNYSVKSDLLKNISIKLMDLNGKLITTVNEGSLQAGDYNRTVNTASLPDGVYFLNAEIEGHRYVLNVIIQK